MMSVTRAIRAQTRKLTTFAVAMTEILPMLFIFILAFTLVYVTMLSGGGAVHSPGDGAVRSSGDGVVRSLGDGTVHSSGNGSVNSAGGGAVNSVGDGAVHSSGDGSVNSAGDGAVRSSGDGAVNSAGDGAVHSSGDGSVNSAGDGAVNSAGDGAVHSPGDGVARSSGDGTGHSPGDGAVNSPGDGAVHSPGDGVVRSSGDGTGHSSGDGAVNSAGDGAANPVKKESKVHGPAGQPENPDMALTHRAETLAENCKQLHGTELNKAFSVDARRLNKIVVNDQFKVMFCVINKVASSTVRGMFLVLDGLLDIKNALSTTGDELNRLGEKLKWLSSFPEQGIRDRLQRYKKIILVREPFERLISAFNDKFKYGRDANLLVMKLKIMETLGIKTPSSAAEYDLSFADFIRYVTLQRDSNEEMDTHWAKYTDLCYPCQVKYDYVGKFETIDDDMAAVIKAIGFDSSVRFPRREDLYKTAKSADFFEEYYKGVPPRHIKQLQKLYSNDTFLFDYAFPDALAKLNP